MDYIKAEPGYGADEGWYRSRLEIAFTYELKARGFTWQYEKRRIGIRAQYLVDFYLPEIKCWVEVKGVFRTIDNAQLPEVAKEIDPKGELLFVYMGDYRAYRVHANGMNPMSHKQMWIELDRRKRSVKSDHKSYERPEKAQSSDGQGTSPVKPDATIKIVPVQAEEPRISLPPVVPKGAKPINKAVKQKYVGSRWSNLVMFAATLVCILVLTALLVEGSTLANHPIDLPTYAVLNTKPPYLTNQIALLELPTSTMFLTITSTPTETTRPSATRIVLLNAETSLPIYTQPPLLTLQAMQQSASIYVLAQSILVRPKPGDRVHLSSEIQQGTVLLINGYNLLPSEQVIWWKVEYSSGKFGWVVDNRQLFQLQNVKFDSAGTPIGVKNIAKP